MGSERHDINERSFFSGLEKESALGKAVDSFDFGSVGTDSIDRLRGERAGVEKTRGDGGGVHGVQKRSVHKPGQDEEDEKRVREGNKCN